MDTEIQRLLAIIQTGLREQPPSTMLIALAQWVMDVYPRALLPDWVEALANGNPAHLPDVCEVVIEFLED